MLYELSYPSDATVVLIVASEVEGLSEPRPRGPNIVGRLFQTLVNAAGAHVDGNRLSFARDRL